MPEPGPELSFRDTGSGPTLLFLHAFPLDSSQWDHQVAALSGDHRCLRPDMWGCGESPAMAAPAAATLAQFAAAVLLGLDRRGGGDAVVVGASMGGYAAFELWRQAPDRIRALVLASARAIADGDSQRADRQAMVERAGREGVEFIVEPMTARLLGPRAQSEAHIADPVRGRIRRCRPDGIIACQTAMAARPDSTGLLAGITVPTLVVAGDQDAIMPLTDSAAMVDAIPGAELAVLPGSGHLANLEDPAAFTAALTDFLARRLSA